jgi:hypothetical protein
MLFVGYVQGVTQWTQSRNPVILSVIHHRQDPSYSSRHLNVSTLTSTVCQQYMVMNSHFSYFATIKSITLPNLH